MAARILWRDCPAGDICQYPPEASIKRYGNAARSIYFRINSNVEATSASIFTTKNLLAM